MAKKRATKGTTKPQDEHDISRAYRRRLHDALTRGRKVKKVTPESTNEKKEETRETDNG